MGESGQSRWVTPFCFLVAILISPLFWTLYFLMLVNRIVVSLLVGRKLTSATGQDIFHGQELDNVNCIIPVAIFLKDRCDFDRLKRRFWNEIVMAKDRKDQKLFPKFSRTLSFRYGFLFWNEEVSMDIENHFWEHPDGPVKSEQELETLINNHFNGLPPSGQPGWDAVMVRLKSRWRSQRHPTEVVPNSVILIRCNHGIMDGMSLTRLLDELVSDETSNVNAAAQKMLGVERLNGNWKLFTIKRNLILTIILLGGVILVPYIIVKVALFQRMKRTLLHQPMTNRKSYCSSKLIPLSKIKSIKNAIGGSSINDVFLSAITGAAEEFIKWNFGEAARGHRGHMHVAIPISVQDLSKPITTSNQLLIFCPELISGLVDARERVRQTARLMQIGKKLSLLILIDFVKRILMLILPRHLVGWIIRSRATDFIFSNISGPPIPIKIIGSKVTEIAAFSPNFHDTGLSVMCISYCDSFTINVVMDTGISKNIEAAQKLIEMVEEQFQILEQALHVGKSEKEVISIPELCDVLVEKCLQQRSS